MAQRALPWLAAALACLLVLFLTRPSQASPKQGSEAASLAGQADPSMLFIPSGPNLSGMGVVIVRHGRSVTSIRVGQSGGLNVEDSVTLPSN